MQEFFTGKKIRSLNEEINVRGLTEDGKRLIIQATDPFHDKPIHPVGLCDSESVPTLTQVIKKSLQISAPGGTAGTWGFSVFSLPENQTVSCRNVAAVYGNYTESVWNGVAEVGSLMGSIANETTDGPASAVVGGLNLFRWSTDVPSTGLVFPNGQDAWTMPSVSHLSNQPTEQVFPYIAKSATRSRVVAAGFELHNTTADIYKQGTLTISRVSNQTRATSVPNIDNTGTTQLLSQSGSSTLRGALPPAVNLVSSGPPSSIEDAMAYPGTRQWDAAEGAYCVLTYDPRENPLVYGQYATRTFLSSDYTVENPTANVTVPSGIGSLTATYDYAGLKNMKAFFPQYVQPTPFSITQVIASGLSKETTFTLTYHVIVEVAPHHYDPSYTALIYSAVPSPKEDQLALELLQRVFADFPSGVPVRMNPGGEFWDVVRKAIHKVAPIVSSGLAMLPSPTAKAAAVAVKMAGEIAKPRVPQPKSKAAQKPGK